MIEIKESGEMYLETILILSKNSDLVRAIDICNYMNYSKPSISRGLSILKERELINVAANGAVTLTEAGLQIAMDIYDKHQLLKSFFTNLGVSEEVATNDACRIEHVISDETFQAIKKHVENKK